MKQNRATESELNEKKILERIAQSLREGWQRDGETWGHVGGRFYRFARVMFYVFTVYAFLLDGAHVLALALALDHNHQKQLSGQTTTIATDEKYAASMGYFRQNLVMMAVLTLLLVLVAVLIYKRKHLTAFVISAVSCILSLAMYTQMMGSSYLYLRNYKGIFTLLYAFTVLIPLNLLWMYLIQWRDTRRVKAEFQRLAAKIYGRYAVGGNIITASQWEEALAEEVKRSAPAPLPERRHRRHYDPGDASPEESDEN